MLKRGSTLFRVILVLVLMAALLVVLIIAIDPLLAFETFEDFFVAFLLFLVSLAAVVWGCVQLARSIVPSINRQANERLVIGAIATVVRQNLPLATGVSLASQSERGAARRYLRQIADLLGQGATLHEAVHRGFPYCSALSLSLITAGERAGQLPAAVTQAENMLIDRTKHWNDRTLVWPYALCVGSMTVLILAGLMVAVVPKYKVICQDFETVLPHSTELLIATAEVFQSYMGLFILIAALIPIGVYLRMRPRRTPTLSWVSMLADQIRWWLPSLGRLEFAQGMNVALKTMSLGVRSGMDLAPSAGLASQVDMNAELRQRLARFTELLDQGSTAREAAKKARLGKVTCIAMASGERSGDMVRALNYAADYYGAIGSRMLTVLRNLAWPLTTLILASMVGFVVVAMFEPLIALIDSAIASVEG